MTDTLPGNAGPRAVAGRGEGGSATHDSLPPFTFRHRLIPAVHVVVAERFDGSARDLSAVYAAVTAGSANALLPGARPYAVQAGCVFVSFPGEKEQVVGPESGPESGFPVHAWAGRRHPSGRMEVADLSTRQFNVWFDRAVLPPRGRFPRAVWAFEDEVPRAFRYAADAEATERVRGSLRTAREDEVAEAVREVVERLRSTSE